MWHKKRRQPVINCFSIFCASNRFEAAPHRHINCRKLSARFALPLWTNIFVCPPPSLHPRWKGAGRVSTSIRTATNICTRHIDQSRGIQSCSGKNSVSKFSNVLFHQQLKNGKKADVRKREQIGGFQYQRDFPMLHPYRWSTSIKRLTSYHAVALRAAKNEFSQYFVANIEHVWSMFYGQTFLLWWYTRVHVLRDPTRKLNVVHAKRRMQKRGETTGWKRWMENANDRPAERRRRGGEHVCK